LFTILITAISFLLLLPSTSALDFTIDVPERVEEGASFEVTINLDASDNYDVKIFAHQGDKNSYISQMNEGGMWRSPRTYMKESFPAQQTYEIKIIDFVGEAEICARLRKTGASSFSEVCEPIYVEETTQGKEEERVEVIQDARIESPAKQDGKIYTNPMRMRIVYAFMGFCALVVGLVWFGKL
jgi:hypothetical protein